LKKGKVDGYSLMESSKCSDLMGLCYRIECKSGNGEPPYHKQPLKRKEERVESPFGFREKPQNLRGGEERKEREGRKTSRLIRVLILISYIWI
jgi:hypothetical protein